MTVHSLLTLPVGDLVDSYDGDSREYAFEGDLPPGYYDDLEFCEPLRLRLKLVSSAAGIEAIIESVETRVVYEDRVREVELHDVVRSFRKTFDPLAPDDIGVIDMKHKAIDISAMIREEIIISLIEL